MNTIDRLIAFFAPQWGVSRAMARATLSQMELFSGSSGGYDAGRLNRLTKGRLGSEIKENAIPSEQIDRLRWQSWNLWRNNTHARKIVRSLESKVVGGGMLPDSIATNDDGSADVAFRSRAKELWIAIQGGFDFRGLPGRGGQTFAGLQRMALRATVLSGESLSRIVPLTPAEQMQRDLPIPMSLQMIDSSRLADDYQSPLGEMPEGHQLYRGIELDAMGRRAAYWIATQVPGNNLIGSTAKRIPAEQISHLYIEDDIDQIRGVPWFAPALLQMRDTADLQYNVLKAAAMASCVVMGYRKPTGTTRFGLNASSEANSTSADGTDLTDADGNAITKIQPGMFVNLGRDGELQGFSPNQPTTNAEAFIQYMLRATAAGFPGVKSSTVTGDYRNSSFSSEKSAENDCWPEIAAVQEWFASSFCQPIYEAVINAGVMSGWFDGIVTAGQFAERRQSYIAARWQGPVSQSINPIDDVTAAATRIQRLLSSPQKECAKINVNWRSNLEDLAEFYQAAESVGLPQEVINNALSVDAQDVIAQSLVNEPTTQEAANVET